jgi:hypothetical protein
VRLAGAAISAYAARDYAQMIYDLAVRRDLIRLGRDIAARAAQGRCRQRAARADRRGRAAALQAGRTGRGRARLPVLPQGGDRCGQHGQCRLSARGAAVGHLDRADRSGQEAGRAASVGPDHPRRAALDGQDLAGDQRRLQHRQGLPARHCARRHRGHGQGRGRRLLQPGDVGRAAGRADPVRGRRGAQRTDPPRRHDRGRVPPLRRGRQGAGGLPALSSTTRRPCPSRRWPPARAG